MSDCHGDGKPHACPLAFLCKCGSEKKKLRKLRKCCAKQGIEFAEVRDAKIDSLVFHSVKSELLPGLRPEVFNKFNEQMKTGAIDPQKASAACKYVIDLAKKDFLSRGLIDLAFATVAKVLLPPMYVILFAHPPPQTE
jgi:hypothetical protein